MAKNTVLGRFANKIDSSENWDKATGFVPISGEFFLVKDADCPIVIGDGNQAAPQLRRKTLFERARKGLIDSIVQKGQIENIAMDEHSDNILIDIYGLLNFYQQFSSKIFSFNDEDNGALVSWDAEKSALTTAPLAKGAGKNSLQHNSCVAGAKAFKVIAIADKGKGIGKYRLNSLEGLAVGMRYVSVLSTANYVGGKITAIDVSNNTITVDGYVHYELNANTDNFEKGDIYNYLMIVDRPDLGNIDVGYHAVALGDGVQVYPVGGFGAGRNIKVLGKFGAGFGQSNEVGHGCLVGGLNNKVRGSGNLGGGSNNTVDSYGNLIGGTLHKLPLVLDSEGESNGNNIVGGSSHTVNGKENIIGGKANTVSGKENIVGGTGNTVEGSQSIVGGSNNTIHENAWRCFVDGYTNTIGEKGGLTHQHGMKNNSNGRAVLQHGEQNESNYDYVHQIGVGHVATAPYQTIIGRYARPSVDALFTIGRGSSKENYSNLFEVIKRADGAEAIKLGNQELTSLHIDYINKMLVGGNLKIGDTVLTEEKLQKIINFIDTIEG